MTRWSPPMATARSRPSSRRPSRGPTRGTRTWRATCGRTTRRGPPRWTPSASNDTRSRPGSTWARTSTSRRPTTGAGPSWPGASLDEATAILNESEYVISEDAYLAWLQDRHDRAIEQLDGVHFDIPAPLRRIEVVLARGSTSGAAYYTGPSEDLTRPGRTWWPLGGRDPEGRFETWSELSTVFHEGVPGHHLQVGAAATAGDRLSRFAKTNFVSGHGEGWALYAERLADELGWFTEPGTRLGMLGGSALRA